MGTAGWPRRDVQKGGGGQVPITGGSLSTALLLVYYFSTLNMYQVLSLYSLVYYKLLCTRHTRAMSCNATKIYNRRERVEASLKYWMCTISFVMCVYVCSLAVDCTKMSCEFVLAQLFWPRVVQCGD